jgi:hypothetical protein
MQRIRLSTQEGPGVNKFMTLDGVVPVAQLAGIIANEFGLKDDQLALSLQSIVCPHPAIIFNDLMETEANFMVNVGVAQMPNSNGSPRSGVSPSSPNPLLISSSNTLQTNAYPIELDFSQSLFQQGVRSGAHLFVIRRKRSLMNKLLGRRKSLLPSSSKDKALQADMNAVLSSSPGSGSVSSTSSPPPTAPHSGGLPIYNVPSRFSRGSHTFLFRLVQCIEATSSACLDLFSHDYSPAFLLAYKTLLDSTSSQSTSEIEHFGDGSALGALLRHCLASMSPKLCEPIQAELLILSEQLVSQTTHHTSQFTNILGKLGQDEKVVLNAWAHLCHDVAELEALNGYTNELLASIFAPLLANVEERAVGVVSTKASGSPTSSSPPPSPQTASKHSPFGQITSVLSHLIDSPQLTGDSPFKKRSKKEKRLRKLTSSSAIPHPGSSSPSPGSGKHLATSGESDHRSSSLENVRRSVDTAGSSSPSSQSPSATAAITKKSSGSNVKGGGGGGGGGGSATEMNSSGIYGNAAREEAASGSGKNSSDLHPVGDSSNASSSTNDDSITTTSTTATTTTNATSTNTTTTSSARDVAAANNQLVATTTTTFMVADFSWTPSVDGDLELHKGDILQVLVADPQGWYVGKLLNVHGNPVGVFPSTYCSTISKKDVSSLLKLEDLSLFESDDASSDDSSSSFSASSLYQHLVAARMGPTTYSHGIGPISPTNGPSFFGSQGQVSPTLSHSKGEFKEPTAVRSFSVGLIQAKSDEIVSPANSEPIVTLHSTTPIATIQDQHTGTEKRSGSARSTSLSSSARGSLLLQQGSASPDHPQTHSSRASTNVSTTLGLNIGLGSESVKPIRYSIEAYAHSKTFPVPPPKGISASRSSEKLSTASDLQLMDFGASPGSSSAVSPPFASSGSPHTSNSMGMASPEVAAASSSSMKNSGNTITAGTVRPASIAPAGLAAMGQLNKSGI